MFLLLLLVLLCKLQQRQRKMEVRQWKCMPERRSVLQFRVLKRIRHWWRAPDVREGLILAALTRIERNLGAVVSIQAYLLERVTEMNEQVQGIENTMDDVVLALADAKQENLEVKATLRTLAETVVAIRADLPTQDVKDALVRVQQKATKVLDDIKAETAGLKAAEDEADDPITPAPAPVEPAPEAPAETPAPAATEGDIPQ